MRYADTAELQRLNDVAKVDQWVTVRFFEAVDPEAIHVLAYAFPHGVRPGSRRPDLPQHWRTFWYAEGKGGRDIRIMLDVHFADFEALPEIPGTPHPFTDEKVWAAAPVVVTDDGSCIDGHQLVRAMRELGKKNTPATVVRALTHDEVSEMRALVSDR